MNNMPWYGYHAYLNEFIKENNCSKIMEIGVYNGENAISMINAATKRSPPHLVEYFGFDFFKRYNINQITEKLRQTGCKFKLFQGDTLDTLPKIVDNLPKMDVIFIDGGKSYKEAMNDWRNSAKLMHGKTGVFVHNAGFSGVRRTIDEIPEDRYKLDIFSPPGEGLVAHIKEIE